MSRPAPNTERPTLENFLDYFNQKHAVVSVSGRTHVLNEEYDPIFERRAISLSDFSDFKKQYSNCQGEVREGRSMKSVPLAQLWLNDSERRQYAGIVFDVRNPGHSSHYNLFQGLPVEPRAGDCDQFKRHIREVLCSGNNTHADYLWEWMAHAVQRPYEIPEVAIVLRGAQGTGKGTFARWFGKLFGSHYLTVQHTSHLTSKFNSHLMDVLVLFADEVTWGGKKEDEGFLKAVITEPEQSVEKKGKDVFMVKNYKRLIIASNEDWCVPIGIGDRRFLVLNVNNMYARDHNYFGAINSEMASGGQEALMHELLTVDLTDFNVRKKPDNEGDAFDLVYRNMSSVDKWIFELLNDSIPENWDLKPIKEDFYHRYLSWCESQKEAHPIAASLFSKRLLKIFSYGPGHHQLSHSRARVNGKLAYCWCMPDFHTAKAYYEEYAGQPCSIWQNGDQLPLSDSAQ